MSIFYTIQSLKYYHSKRSLHYYILFGTWEATHNYNTRLSSNNNLKICQIHSSKYRCCFYVNGMKHWGNLHCHLKSARSKFCFRRKLRLHLSLFSFYFFSFFFIFWVHSIFYITVTLSVFTYVFSFQLKTIIFNILSSCSCKTLVTS